MDDVLAGGRLALQRGAWKQARAAFEAVVDCDARPEAYEGLGAAALGGGDLAAGLAAHEAAYRCFRERRDAHGAGRVAAQLGWNYFNLRGEPAIANGWTRRAHRLLDGLDLLRADLGDPTSLASAATLIAAVENPALHARIRSLRATAAA